LEVQSSGAARAAVTTLITSAVAIDVLIVRMGVSSELLHYARFEGRMLNDPCGLRYSRCPTWLALRQAGQNASNWQTFLSAM
jgi:hypothetical protein